MNIENDISVVNNTRKESIKGYGDHGMPR